MSPIVPSIYSCRSIYIYLTFCPDLSRNLILFYYNNNHIPTAHHNHNNTDGTAAIRALGGDCHETENVLETGEENDLASCESMCKRKINCIGLSWDTQTKVCRTHSFLSCEEADTSVGTSTFYERFLPSACTACPPAKYQAAPLSNACSDCPLATFAGGVGNTLVRPSRNRY